MKKQIWLPILILAVLVAGVLIYSSQRPAQPEEKEVIKIGAILPLTGKAAQYGQWAKNGFDLATEEINSLNYPYHLEMIYEDDAGDPKTSVNAFQKMISINKPAVVVGVIQSKTALAVAPMAEQNKIVLLSTGASADDIRSAGDYIFRVRESGLIHGQSMDDYAFETLAIKKVGMFYVNAESGITYAQALKEQFQKLGGR